MTEERIDLKKNVFSKAQYIKTINTSFNELGVTTIAEDLTQQPNIEEFFQQYNDLFYDIPPNGATNSHEYLVVTSGEYINFEENNEEIEALRAEISQLRADNLSLQMENLKLQTNENTSPDILRRMSEIQSQLDEAQSKLADSSNQLSQDLSGIGETTEEEVDPRSNTNRVY
jgi:DNA repair exonuclease SbcCD ATPase subunit